MTEQGSEGQPFLEFRGHGLGIQETPNALIHLYRAQVGRADNWRQRLDSSTNWAVVTVMAGLSVTFSEPTASHLVLPLSALLVTLFWGIESRRYRYFELWSYRVHLLEEAYFAKLLSPELMRNENWTVELARSLREPHFTITLAEALGRRYRRVYVWVYTVLALSWCIHIWLHPFPATSLHEVLNRPIMGYIPAYVILTIGFFFYFALLTFGLVTFRMREASGEVFRSRPGEPDVETAKGH